MAIELPNKWQARHYQADLFKYMFAPVPGHDCPLDQKRAVEVWHRRAGKDSCAINLAAVASQMRIGTIWHMLPTLKQGRRVIWDSIDRDGRKLIKQAFPPEMVASQNNSDMKLELQNGSIYQVVGSDNYDSLVGTNPVGVIFSEFSIADPTAWDYIRPILTENDGWAVFIYTSRGKNHGYKLLEMARKNPRWHYSAKTVDDTYRALTLPNNPAELATIPRVVPKSAIEEERKAGMAEERIQQEFYCSFEIGLEGAFYTKELALAESEGRVGEYPWDPTYPCQTWWDIGFRDATSIIITQRGEDGNPIVIDHLEERNMGLDMWIRTLNSLPYNYEEHNGPHDLDQTDWSTGKTRREMAQNLGVSFNIVPKLPVADGIDQTRAMIRKARFNRDKVEKLLNSLACYHRDFDQQKNVYKDQPVHDWSSHGADNMRYLSVGWVNTGGRMGDEHVRSPYKVLSALR